MENLPLSPIILFAYKRADTLAKTIEALQHNSLAIKSNLYVFVDGPKRPNDVSKVNEVRLLVDNISGFKSVERYYSEANIGLADSVIRGVSQVLKIYQSVIVLEDDLIPSHNFLDFMNQCLNNYSNNKQIFSISGYSMPFKKPDGYQFDAFTFPRTGSWGWATWADRWQLADWQVSDYNIFKTDKEAQRRFNEGGSDRTRMLRHQQQGTINSWAIRWCYNQFKQGGYTIYPTESKIQNIGFSEDSTHTNVYNRYKTMLDNGERRTFELPSVVTPIEAYKRQFRMQYSIPIRVFNRLKTYAGLRM
ncbi:glycosyltransferase family protein [Spirosoma radiotolerans]|uniref:Glycosyltransferase n=1 Tax=Spirosoma radiotolerans TaxID=1379870 RepID=A0A0E4A1R3_9BACT|nr:glycosyltransferase family 2 protein [Spirosoma radiotolerans]AKD58703.1 glycosyltransferase [Spirosoma radiotolerans]